MLIVKIFVMQIQNIFPQMVRITFTSMKILPATEKNYSGM